MKVYKIECIFNGVNEWVDETETEMNITATPTPTPTPDNTPAFSAILSNAKEGQCFMLDKSGKSFTKIAGMIAAPDMDAYESVRMTVSAEFFNTRVVRIAYARVRRI